MTTGNPTDVNDDSTKPATLSEPCGFCLNGFHDMCPRSVARNDRTPDRRLVCPCPDDSHDDPITDQLNAA